MNAQHRRAGLCLLLAFTACSENADATTDPVEGPEVVSIRVAGFVAAAGIT